MEVTVNGHQVTPAARITVLLDAEASRGDVTAAEQFVTELTGGECSIHFLKAGTVAIVPATPDRQPPRRYAHGGGATNRPRRTQS